MYTHTQGDGDSLVKCNTKNSVYAAQQRQSDDDGRPVILYTQQTCFLLASAAYLEVYIFACRDILEVHLQDFLAALHIRVGDCDVTVKSARPDQGFVQRLWEVGGSYADNPITGLEPIAHMLVSSHRNLASY